MTFSDIDWEIVRKSAWEELTKASANKMFVSAARLRALADAVNQEELDDKDEEGHKVSKFRKKNYEH